MIIRGQLPGDAAAVGQVLTDVFSDDGRVAALAEALSARPDRPDACLVAELGGEVVGHVQLSRSWIDTPQRLVDVLVLSPLGVARAHQRRGIGRALVEAAVARATQLGSPAVFLEGDPVYYARLGWRAGADYGFRPPSDRIPRAAFQVVALPGYQPWMTGQLVYNDAFWTHDCVGLRGATSGAGGPSPCG